MFSRTGETPKFHQQQLIKCQMAGVAIKELGASEAKWLGRSWAAVKFARGCYCVTHQGNPAANGAASPSQYGIQKLFRFKTFYN